ncbi:MAG: FAD-dependent oxidoreductase [Magnetospirillum sp.]|nr:FAD-dependent oxidoreductase [Magnetospirillum sp.]
MDAATKIGVVILGSGLGGYTLARELRKLDREIALTVITADGGESYSKPMLSAAFAQGKAPASLVQKGPEQMAVDLSATILVRHRIAAIHRDTKTLTLRQPDGNETSIGYGRLVLAIGADPRLYQAPGAELAKIRTVNDLDDYALWREALRHGDRVLLVGAGLIGCEFANDLAGAGFKVTMVDPAPWPLGRLLPQDLGEEMAKALAGVGVSLHLGRTVASWSAAGATLDDGGVVAFDHALSAIGLVPRIRLATEAGLKVDRGIVVDRSLRTSDPDIFAIGDCAESPAGPLPFVLPLMAEAKALAATLTGTETPLQLPALPVVVKTPCLPMAVCPPAPGAVGQWRVEGEGRDRKALFIGSDGRALGFALSGGRVSERQSLGREMPDLL